MKGDIFRCPSVWKVVSGTQSGVHLLYSVVTEQFRGFNLEVIYCVYTVSKCPIYMYTVVLI